MNKKYNVTVDMVGNYLSEKNMEEKEIDGIIV